VTFFEVKMPDGTVSYDNCGPPYCVP
jgi:hypothetical protein